MYTVGGARYRRAWRSLGFTLLEVILALALSTIVIGAVGLGIFVYYRAFDWGRDEVEEAQLARGLEPHCRRYPRRGASLD